MESPGQLSFFFTADLTDRSSHFLAMYASNLVIAVWTAHNPPGADGWLQYVIHGFAATWASDFSRIHVRFSPVLIASMHATVSFPKTRFQ
jgi:hypothetical protein